MKIINSLKELSTIEKLPIVLTIGNFDGVHLGHQFLISKSKSVCLNGGFKLVVLTFNPHPHQILSQNFKNYLLTSYEDKKSLLSKTGVDYLVELNFDRDFSTKKPEDFLNEYILIYPNIKEIHVGHDFMFGINKSGNFELISQEASKRNISVFKQDRFEFNQKVISSTEIRKSLSCGDIETANQYLGRNFFISGRVIKGDGRGKKIGFPTANINYEKELLIPQRGVYITRTHLGELNYNSLTNIGFNPTFKDEEVLSLENHILDFNQDIYGERIKVEFLKKIREEKKFSSVNDLIAQIQQDVKITKEFFKA
jgi:riboflavin kinase/FMN adenylyltransferase